MGILSLKEIVITPRLLKTIAELDEFKGAWAYLKRLTPERLNILKKVATIESIGSSTRIEGAKLTDREVETLLKGAGKESFQTRDQQEVAGYGYVCEQISEHFADIPLTENFIKQLHIGLLQYTDKDQRHRGEYKKIPIRIEAFDHEENTVGTIFETVSPFETPLRMKELVDWTNGHLDRKDLHPLIVIALFTVIFLAIHPFQDGNGRLSRLLTLLLMLKSGYQYAPYSSLESIIEKNKDNYYLALQQSQKSWQMKNPNWEPWFHFFFEALIRQKVHLETKLQREQVLMHEYSESTNKVLTILQDQGRLGIGQIAALSNINRNTLKKILANLVESDLISKHGQGKGTWYTLS